MQTLPFKNTFASLGENFYSRVSPTPVRSPRLLHSNLDVAKLLGIPATTLNSEDFLACASGLQPLTGMEPLAQVYSGHQFGQWAGQLGDGRGLLLGELNGLDLHLKGAGKTPYSRFGDGRAVLRSSLREYLAGEFMHQLGIPTSRALSLVGSEEPVWRESYESAATIIRTAESHIRFGHFEHFHYGRQPDQVKQLADYVMARHYPHCQTYAEWFSEVVSRTATLMAQWQVAGFTHGVMNTDNMSILGLTLDYGPYGFIDDYTPNFVCNHSDHHGRYAFDQQPSIGLWNLNALAVALSTLIDGDDLRAGLAQYEPTLVSAYLSGMATRLGLSQDYQREDEKLIAELLALLEKERCDYHLALRALADDEEIFCQLFKQHSPSQWLKTYQQRKLHSQDAKTMQQLSNPRVVLRNHLLQLVINDVETGSTQLLEEYFVALQQPFSAPANALWMQAPQDDDKGLALSCSS
ncbi:MAG: hypothetical protein RL336_1939 [Pseudomonadota bacterium]